MTSIRNRPPHGAARAAALAAAIALAGPAAAADPPDKGTCARSYEQAQRHRQARELKAAKEELLVCSRPECPTSVRRDCVPWLGEVEAAMPSVVVVSPVARAQARASGRIIIDGAAIPDPSTSEPIPLDPGEHLLVFEASGYAREERRITLREGDRERRVELTLTPTEKPPAPMAKSESSLEHADEKESHGTPTLAYVLGGVGIALAGAGAYFQVSGMSKRSDLYDCAPRCTAEAVDEARQTLWAGNIVLGAAVVSLAAAAWIYLSQASDHSQLSSPAR